MGQGQKLIPGYELVGLTDHQTPGVLLAHLPQHWECRHMSLCPTFILNSLYFWVHGWEDARLHPSHQSWPLLSYLSPSHPLFFLRFYFWGWRQEEIVRFPWNWSCMWLFAAQCGHALLTTEPWSQPLSPYWASHCVDLAGLRNPIVSALPACAPPSNSCAGMSQVRCKELSSWGVIKKSKRLAESRQLLAHCLPVRISFTHPESSQGEVSSGKPSSKLKSGCSYLSQIPFF